MEERSRLLARQGQAFATAEQIRVVYASEADMGKPLRDVPRDGNTVGEVVMRGNVVMKEVRYIFIPFIGGLLHNNI